MPRGVYERKPKGTTVSDENTTETETAEICGDCWPTGWPEDATSAGCEHGQWSRDAVVEPDEDSDDGADA